jgi:hypothetical protein
MRWDNDGCLGIITGGQLDRKLYERLNKALEAMGGKWNRKAAGHVFTSDPRPHVEGLLENGILQIERDGFFETPPAVVQRMLVLVPIQRRDCLVLEPSAGLGAIANALPVPREQVICVEKNSERCKELTARGFTRVHCGNFLDICDYTVDRIYMNPPFEDGQDIDHVRHAFDCLAPGGMMVAVMSEGAFFREDHRSCEFREWLTALGGYSERLPQGSFKESGTGVNARLVVLSAED